MKVLDFEWRWRLSVHFQARDHRRGGNLGSWNLGKRNEKSEICMRSFSADSGDDSTFSFFRDTRWTLGKGCNGRKRQDSQTD